VLPDAHPGPGDIDPPGPPLPGNPSSGLDKWVIFASMGGVFRRVVAVMCVILAAAISACSTTSPSTTLPAMQTPTQVAYSWLAATNAKDLRTSDSYLAHAPGLEPGIGTTSQWPTFADVQCQPEKTESNAAQVLCTFNIRSGPLREVHGYLFNMTRRADRRWLIVAYGSR